MKGEMIVPITIVGQNSVKFDNVGVFYDRKRKEIHITFDGHAHFTITNKPNSKNYNESGFKQLRKVLEQNGVVFDE